MSNKGIKPMDFIIGENLTISRKLKGMTSQHIAEKIGITQQQFSKYQTGSNRITASRLHEVSEIVGKPVEYFFVKRESK